MSRPLFFSILILFCSSTLLGLTPADLAPVNLMPLPAKMRLGDGKFGIDSGFEVAITGAPDPRLERAVVRFLRRLSEQTGIPIAPVVSKAPTGASLRITCASPGEAVQTPRADESYTLEIGIGGAKLEAPDAIGIIRGLETFLQWVTRDSTGFVVRTATIEDRPRFRWRGLLIDAGRHWMPVDVIKRNLDAMAAVKLNVLHWHLSEDQGFRVESKRFPRLHELGSDGNYYTQSEIRSVIEYARDRAIRVVPEFDMPGHTTAWFPGYPELASAPGPYQIERKWGVFDPTMDPAKETTYRFLDDFIGEMAALFPDLYFHIGGDENNGKQWDANPQIQAFKRTQGIKTNHDLQAYFNKRVLAIVQKHGKKMIGWDEVLHPDLPRDIIIHSWRGQDSLAQAAKDGFSGLLSNGYYLDLALPASDHYVVDPMDKTAAALSEDQKERILGGEACMWAEYVSPETIDSRIWPRAAAVAERLWSPASVRDLPDMYRRLEFVDRHLEWAGAKHRTGYRQMLERMAGSSSVETLKTLADVLEPVKRYSRGRARAYTSFVPLNRLVDATRPESDRAREFSQQVDRMLAGGAGADAARDSVREWLQIWKANHERLRDTLKENFLLEEIRPISEDVSTLANAGLQAMDYLKSGKPFPANWKAEQNALLERASKPRAELLIMIAPPIRKLLGSGMTLGH